MNKQRTWKKNRLERVNKRQYTPSVFKEQIGHFEQLLDVFGISSNLGEVSGIYLKVYDGLSWDFVLDVLEKLNFSPH